MLKHNDEIVAISNVHSSVEAGGGYTIGAWRKVYSYVSEKLVEDIKNEYDKLR